MNIARVQLEGQLLRHFPLELVKSVMESWVQMIDHRPSRRPEPSKIRELAMSLYAASKNSQGELPLHAAKEGNYAEESTESKGQSTRNSEEIISEETKEHRGYYEEEEERKGNYPVATKEHKGNYFEEENQTRKLTIEEVSALSPQLFNANLEVVAPKDLTREDTEKLKKSQKVVSAANIPTIVSVRPQDITNIELVPIGKGAQGSILRANL